MRARDIKELSDQELATRERDLVEEIFHLGVRRTTGQLDSPARLAQLRRDLARVKTIARERALARRV